MPPLRDWPFVRQRGRGAPHHPPGLAAACAPRFPHPGQCSRRRLLGRLSHWSGNEWAFLSCLFFFFLSPVLALSPSTRGGRRPVRGAGAPWSARRNWGGRPRGEGGQRADTAPGGGDRRRRCRRRCCHRVHAGGGATPPPPFRTRATVTGRAAAGRGAGGPGDCGDGRVHPHGARGRRGAGGRLAAAGGRFRSSRVFRAPPFPPAGRGRWGIPRQSPAVTGRRGRRPCAAPLPTWREPDG